MEATTEIEARALGDLHILQGLIAFIFHPQWAGGQESLLLEIGMSLSQSGSLSQGISGSIKHILNPSFDRRKVLTTMCYSFVRGSI